jgi:putative transport protein
VQVLRQHPEIALFLTLAAGYALGKVRLGGHELGLVTGALFAGLFIAQLNIEIRPEIKTIFLSPFLFANGYGAGPQFFRALKKGRLCAAAVDAQELAAAGPRVSVFRLQR